MLSVETLPMALEAFESREFKRKSKEKRTSLLASKFEFTFNRFQVKRNLLQDGHKDRGAEWKNHS